MLFTVHNTPMVKLLMKAGADVRKDVCPNRDATSALTLARDREYSEIIAIIKEEERQRREEMSCLNATVSPAQDQIQRRHRLGAIKLRRYACLKQTALLSGVRPD